MYQNPAEAFEEMKNKILLKRASLIAAIETLNYKINHLSQFFSKPQIRCWKQEKKVLQFKLGNLPTEKQIQDGAKRINYSNTMP